MTKQKKASAAAIGLIAVAALVITVAAVSYVFPYQPNNPPIVNTTGSTPAGIQEVVEANNNFAFDLYSEISKKESGNLFYSPYSISSALVMTYEGAKGPTSDEIKSVFHFPDKQTLRSNFAAIYTNLNKNKEDYQLNTGNALWVQKDFQINEDYKTTVENFYGGKATNLDFIKETEKSRQTINDFIEQQTNDKIKDLIPKGALDATTRLVLTNAIYFKGTWKWEFEETNTQEQNFKVSDSKTVTTKMMSMRPQKSTFNYLETENLQILELPYKGEDISMLIILPKENIDSLDLTAEKLTDYKSQMRETKLTHISIPKFEFDTKYFMSETLSSLGMPAAFTDNADFSGISDAEQLKITSVIHQAYIKVDEQGTEAAAATGVVMGITSAGGSTDFIADHPFIFLIQDNKTGNILFFGKVVDPTQ